MVCGIGTYQPIFLHVGLLVGYWQGPTKIEVASVLNFRKFSRFFETSRKRKPNERDEKKLFDLRAIRSG